LTKAGIRAAVLADGGIEFSAACERLASDILRDLLLAGIRVNDFRRLDTGLADVALSVLKGGQPV